ncbi:glycoside hydrolase family 28 protein [Martelella lutilitoris]|uniref:Glycoside hydrolase family 28 protein n=1 Tax=Martelella lutilitoris TaxID=2583532 RepID=A0A5C4JRQ8_9HYPH|nr:glycoside hydrolase family 28 protein [Martelella lutilitoris]TNB47379.1 glycoside hydrolase family 28 protein [Martelella lutilitoris]
MQEIRIPASAGDATSRIQSAIDEAAKTPVAVVLEAGTHICGGLRLISNVELRLEDGAVLQFLPDYDAYAAHPVRVVAEGSDRAMISATDASDIAITGKGRMVCGGKHFATGKDAEMGTLIPAAHRPRLLVLDSCTQVTLSEFSVTDSPMWTLHFVNCEGLSIDNVSVENALDMPNTDGIVIDGCRDVTVRRCDISTADDGVVLKTSCRPDGTVVGACERIEVADCRVRSHSCALKIGTESFGDFRDITFRNCEVIASNRGLGIFSRDGGAVENVRFSDISLDCRETPPGFWGSGEALTINLVDRRPETRPAGRISGVIIENISGSMEGAINLYCERRGGIENIEMRTVALHQRPGAYGTALCYDLRPTPADLAEAPASEGRANAWRKGADGRVIGLVDYPGGMPAVFSHNVKGLSLQHIEIDRPKPLPAGFSPNAVTVD